MLRLATRRPNLSLSGKYSVLTHSAVMQRGFNANVQVAQPKDSKRLDENEEPRFLEQVKLFYESGASKTGIDAQWLELIKACQTVVRFNIPLRRDNGDLEVITCYR